MIGERLLKLRKEAGMTQEELADFLSLTKYTISAYENDKSSPADEVKMQIAKLFDVSVDYLIGLIDDPRSYKTEPDQTMRFPHRLPPSAWEELNTFRNYMMYKYGVREEGDTKLTVLKRENI